MLKVVFKSLIAGVILFSSIMAQATPRQMEYLNRGVVAIKLYAGVYVNWRLLGTDDPEVGFNVYRDGELLNTSPITNSTNYIDTKGTATSAYTVLAVVDGVEYASEDKAITPLTERYLTLKLNQPDGGITEPNRYGSVGKTEQAAFPDGQPYTYTPNDCSVGDLDGDGEYEIIVKWDPTNSQDNSYYGITGKVYIDAYKLDGTQLWRIDLGKNIRAGAHYTQFLVYDFDGDGLAEMVCKTAPGTIDGEGNYVIMGDDDPESDYRSLDYSQNKGSKMLGTVLNGPEYLTLFDGLTGAELSTVAYEPARGSLSSWGDTYGNRSERYLACVAYLDGDKPSAVMCRGYYARTTLAAYNVVDKKLEKQWLYDASTKGVGAYGQGNHNLSVGDVDKDGKDEIIYGSCAIDNDGTLLYRTGLGHGDAIHMSDMDLDNDGLEVWCVHEEKEAEYGLELHDAATGEILWGQYTGYDVGRGMAGDIDASYPGFEMWGEDGTYTNKGEKISSKKPSKNFRVYWDADLQDELLDGTSITKWNGNGTSTLLSASGVSSCNSTKATPNLSADIWGDWREEVVLWNSSNASELRIYTTVYPTTYRLFTLMHDPVYRLGVAWQNTSYNQPPHLGFYIGDGVENVEQPDIYTVKAATPTPVKKVVQNIASIQSIDGIVKVVSNEEIESVEIYTLQGQCVYKNMQVNSTSYMHRLPMNSRISIVRVKTASGIQTEKIVR